MVKREKIEAGKTVLPRTRTSSVPTSTISHYRSLQNREDCTISSFVEAMLRIAIAGEYHDLVATIL